MCTDMYGEMPHTGAGSGTLSTGMAGMFSFSSFSMPGSGMRMGIFQEFHAHFMDTGSGIEGDIFQRFLKDGNGKSFELTAPKCK